MNLREPFLEKDVKKVQAFIAANSFATFVSSSDENEPVASHLPVDFVPSQGPRGTLIAHIANANEHVRFLTPDRLLLIIISSADAYISPSWFTDRASAPTQTQLVVHCYGYPRRITDREKIRAIMERQVHSREQGRLNPWQTSELGPQGYERRLQAISGIEMPIHRMLASFRLMQDETDARNVQGAIDRLKDNGAQEMAHHIATANKERLG